MNSNCRKVALVACVLFLLFHSVLHAARQDNQLDHQEKIITEYSALLDYSRLLKPIKMPMVKICTNIKKENIKDGFLQEASGIFQEMIGKPMQYIAVYINPDQMMSFGGSTEPCACIDMVSAGKIGKEENIKYTKTITEVMGKLGVPPDRMYVLFVDIARENCGYNGTTLAAK